MSLTKEPMQAARPVFDRLLVVLLAASMVAALASVWIFTGGKSPRSVFLLSNLVGPTTQSLLAGKGLSVCTEAMGTPGNPICFHAGRMPMATLSLALGVRLFGDNYLRADVLKTILLLLPLDLAIVLVWRRTPRASPLRLLIGLMLLLPFAMPAFLADVTNMQVEEGFSYSFLALAVAILLFALDAARPRARALLLAAVFALAVDGVYLAKSSMVLAAAALLLGYLLLEKRRDCRILVVLLVAAAPLGWALHQHHVSGRYSFGTSIDGINLHKANNDTFLEHYPPPPGETLDRYDADLNRGLHFSDEWSFNDYHQHAGFAYMLAHPREDAAGDLRKLDIIFFSLKKYGSAEEHGVMRLIEPVTLLAFHLLFAAALVGAFLMMVKPAQPERWMGAVFLATVAACLLPYLLGFVYTRHISVLIYPAVLMCCRMLLRQPARATR